MNLMVYAPLHPARFSHDVTDQMVVLCLLSSEWAVSGWGVVSVRLTAPWVLEDGQLSAPG